WRVTVSLPNSMSRQWKIDFSFRAGIIKDWKYGLADQWRLRSQPLEHPSDVVGVVAGLSVRASDGVGLYANTWRLVLFPFLCRLSSVDGGHCGLGDAGPLQQPGGRIR